MFNPFGDCGIVSYEQYKQYPFLMFGVQKTIDDRITQQINQIKNSYFFGERLILISERGAGKTTTLFYLQEKLKKEGIKSYLVTRLIQDFEHFNIMTHGNLVQESDKSAIYILVDFPDTIEFYQYKQFLLCLWQIISHQNQSRINLIFAMNHRHYDKAFSYSEILGKFVTVRLERLSFEESANLIESRLHLIDKTIEDIFEPTSIDSIFKFTKGIPRNIISACGLLFNRYEDHPLPATIVNELCKDQLFDQIIKDRVDDLQKRREFIQIIDIIKNDFKGEVTSKLELVKVVQERIGLGRTSIFSRLADLQNFGILYIRRGGYNNVNRIISLEG